MKRVEGNLIKLIMIHFIFILGAQLLIQYTDVTQYVSKVIEYEGVSKGEHIRPFKQ